MQVEMYKLRNGVPAHLARVPGFVSAQKIQDLLDALNGLLMAAVYVDKAGKPHIKQDVLDLFKDIGENLNFEFTWDLSKFPDRIKLFFGAINIYDHVAKKAWNLRRLGIYEELISAEYAMNKFPVLRELWDAVRPLLDDWEASDAANLQIQACVDFFVSHFVTLDLRCVVIV